MADENTSVVRVRGAGRAVLRALVAVLMTAGGLLGGVAHAETAHQAQARVDGLLTRITDLQRQAGAALGAYDAALQGLATAVSAEVSAGEVADAAAARLDDVRRQLDARVRGLYMAGGSAAMYATVLDASDLQDLLSRGRLAARVLSVDRQALVSATRRAAGARLVATRRSAAAARSVTTVRGVQQAADRLQSLLDRQQALLDEARTRAGRLAAVEQAQRLLAAQRADAQRAAAGAVTAARVLPASAAYMNLYRAAAATCPGLPWTVLAAVGQVESGHGRDVSTSSAGARGPMQFLPATFARMAVDGDGDGRVDIMDPADAIFTAAHYLCSNGGGQGDAGVANALWHYNHAGWYVDMVLALARQYAAA